MAVVKDAVKVDEEPVEAKSSAGRSSLKARMQARQEELSKRKTEIFPIPRYDSLMAVELKAIPWEKTEDIIERHQNQASRQTLNSSADELVVATVGFHEIKEDGTLERLEDVRYWSEVAQNLLEVDPPDAPFATRERICMTALISDQGVMALAGPYRRWLGGANVGISERVRRDFSTTP